MLNFETLTALGHQKNDPVWKYGPTEMHSNYLSKITTVQIRVSVSRYSVTALSFKPKK